MVALKFKEAVDKLIAGEKEKLTDTQILEEVKQISLEKSEIIKERKLKLLKEKTDISLATLRKELEKVEVKKEASPAIQQLTKLANLNPTIREEVWHLLAEEDFDKATEKIVEFIKSKEYIYTTRDDIKTEVWIYENGVYVPKGRSYIKEICREVLGRAYTDVRANHVINKIEVDSFIEPEEFFRERNLEEVCVQNGILNIITRELKSFNPDKIFFNKIPVAFIPKGVCPKIDKFLSDILKKDDIPIAYELAGFGLRREYFIELAAMLLGSGRNGKGKYLELLKRFVGAENTCNVHLTNMQYKTSAICELHNRLFNLGGDLNNTSLQETGMFKQLTGRDIVQVPRKYLRDLIFQNYAKHIFAANELPKVYDKSIGFWSRWLLLEFPNRFLPQKEFDKLSESERENCKILNPNIIEEIATPEELSGFLNKALEGLARLMKNKCFSYSKSTKQVMDTWVRNSDSFQAFCFDMLVEDPEGRIFKEDLRKLYLKYRKKHRLPRGESDISIKRTLQEFFGADEQREPIYEGVTYPGDKFPRSVRTGEKAVWVGISIGNNGGTL